MTSVEIDRVAPEDGVVVRRLEKQIRDYVNITRNMVWQRQAIFFAATTLTACYFDAATAIACYGAVLATEAVDHVLARRAADAGAGLSGASGPRRPGHPGEAGELRRTA